MLEQLKPCPNTEAFLILQLLYHFHFHRLHASSTLRGCSFLFSLHGNTNGTQTPASFATIRARTQWAYFAARDENMSLRFTGEFILPAQNFHEHELEWERAKVRNGCGKFGHSTSLHFLSLSDSNTVAGWGLVLISSTPEEWYAQRSTGREWLNYLLAPVCYEEKRGQIRACMYRDAFTMKTSLLVVLVRIVKTRLPLSSSPIGRPSQNPFCYSLSWFVSLLSFFFLSFSSLFFLFPLRVYSPTEKALKNLIYRIWFWISCPW